MGIALVMAAGCALNNLIDRDIDKLMERTKNRASARGLISGKIIFLYACFLGILGILLLLFQTNLLTTGIALLGLFFYVVIYSLWFKRHSLFGTMIGSISGATPPVVGYCAVSNTVDLGALLLFLSLCFWQMPHSFAIAIYRLEDYTAAKISVLPVKKGIPTTKCHMLFYILAFTIAASLLYFFHFTGLTYLIVMLAVGTYWFWQGILGYSTSDNTQWAKKMFLLSIIVIILFSIMLVFG
jgi:protoheme IX farnesyltransferase